MAEHGERPWETPVRECREETGFHLPGPPRLLATVFGLGKDWPPATAGFVFDGGRLSSGELAAIVLDPDEHDQVRALTVPEWRDLMPGRDHARLEAVVAARRAGIPTYFDTWDWEV
ncbi:NUDIX hydrolase [Streptomyces sp. NPDC048269]|uniref:NUDIX hydrolase n=1 Tax=Streptomyces sp. NPDC048269 TaxID=3155753 RepID=UPI003444338D